MAYLLNQSFHLGDDAEPKGNDPEPITNARPPGKAAARKGVWHRDHVVAPGPCRACVSRALGAPGWATRCHRGTDQESWSVTCTTSASRFVVIGSPHRLKTFSIGAFSGRTSATNCFSPALRASARKWRISAAPMPCP